MKPQAKSKDPLGIAVWIVRFFTAFRMTGEVQNDGGGYNLTYPRAFAILYACLKEI